jgi:signal transduction histidine kinase
MESTSPSRRVLVVEDDEDSAELVVEVLSDAGYIAERVANGLEALERLEHDPLPSLVLLDLHMPIMDGREFRLRQQASPRFRDLPVIIVSADTAATAAIDAEYVLRKPFTAESLEHAVRNAFAALEREYARAERLAHLDRLASLGTMTASLGHEISNPLTYVLMSLDFLERELGTLSSELPEGRLAGILGGLGELRSGADRVRSIVRSLRIAARGEWGGTSRLALPPVLSSAAIIAGGEIRLRAQLREAIGTTPVIQGDETKLTQVFVNLLVNAAQAMQDITPYRNEIELRSCTDPVGRAVIEIHDTGCGIPDELQARVFDPFFTTKPVGLGTGLGLFVSRSIVEAHGGSITFESEVGRGTTFRVSLPPAPEPQ